MLSHFSIFYSFRSSRFPPFTLSPFSSHSILPFFPIFPSIPFYPFLPFDPTPFTLLTNFFPFSSACPDPGVGVSPLRQAQGKPFYPFSTPFLTTRPFSNLTNPCSFNEFSYHLSSSARLSFSRLNLSARDKVPSLPIF